MGAGQSILKLIEQPLGVSAKACAVKKAESAPARPAPDGRPATSVDRKRVAVLDVDGVVLEEGARIRSCPTHKSFNVLFDLETDGNGRRELRLEIKSRIEAGEIHKSCGQSSTLTYKFGHNMKEFRHQRWQRQRCGGGYGWRTGS